MHLPDNSTRIAWTVHLARQEPLKGALALGMLVAVACIGTTTVGPYTALVACIISILSLRDFLFPVSYQVSAEGARMRGLLRKAEVSWDDVRNCYLDDSGIKLSPFDRQSRLETFRGLYLRFGGNREQVILAVRELRRDRCN